MTDPGLIKEKIDELLEFLPSFERLERSYYKPEPEGGETQTGPLMTYYPNYCDDVLAFFSKAGQQFWADYGYEPHRAGNMLNNPQRLASATIKEIRTMLTYCVRSERFGDGAWGALLESGRVQMLLRRLQEIRHQIQ